MLGLLPLPLNSTITIKRTAQYAWGIESISGVEKYYRVRVTYDPDEVRVDTLQGATNGAVIFVGAVEVLKDDILEIEGRNYRPKKIDLIRDFSGEVIHTGVYF